MPNHLPNRLLFSLGLLCAAVFTWLLVQEETAPPMDAPAIRPNPLPHALSAPTEPPTYRLAAAPEAAAAVAWEPNTTVVEGQVLLPSASHDVGECFERLDAAVAAGAHEATLAPLRAALAAALREAPERLAWLRTRLVPAHASPELLRELFAAIAASATPAAERFLVAMAREGDPGSAGQLALHALVAADTLSPLATDELLLLLDDHTVAPVVASTCLVGLGRLAGQGRQPDLLSILLAREVVCRQRGLVSTWLAALANSGNSEAVDVAVRCTTAGAAAERAAAAAALHTAQSPAAVQALLRLAAHDPAVEVRAAAVGGLVGRGAEAFATLERVALADPDASMRRLAIANLADSADREAVRRVLTAVAHHDLSAELRALASELLAAP